MTTATAPVIDVVNLNEDQQTKPVVILEESPMTDSELVELETQEELARSADLDATKLRLIQAKAIHTIFEQKLYRGKYGNRSFEDYLRQEGHKLSATAQSFSKNVARRLRGWYVFRNILTTKYSNVPLPAYSSQVEPLIAQLETHPEVAVEIWKGAISQAKRISDELPDKTKTEKTKKERALSPSLALVTQATNTYLANRANAARRPSPKQVAGLSAAHAASMQARQKPKMHPPAAPSASSAPSAQVHQVPPQPQIPAWELQKTDQRIDPRRELADITKSVNAVFANLDSVLAFLKRGARDHGMEYFEMLKAVDAGIYSFKEFEDTLEAMRIGIEETQKLISGEIDLGSAQEVSVKVNFPNQHGASK